MERQQNLAVASSPLGPKCSSGGLHSPTEVRPLSSKLHVAGLQFPGIGDPFVSTTASRSLDPPGATPASSLHHWGVGMVQVKNETTALGNENTTSFTVVSFTYTASTPTVSPSDSPTSRIRRNQTSNCATARPLLGPRHEGT